MAPCVEIKRIGTRDSSGSGADDSFVVVEAALRACNQAGLIPAGPVPILVPEAMPCFPNNLLPTILST